MMVEASQTAWPVVSTLKVLPRPFLLVRPE
jgi:hypothetical protein